jgi:hypothetical protein
MCGIISLACALQLAQEGGGSLRSLSPTFCLPAQVLRLKQPIWTQERAADRPQRLVRLLNGSGPPALGDATPAMPGLPGLLSLGCVKLGGSPCHASTTAKGSRGGGTASECYCSSFQFRLTVVEGHYISCLALKSCLHTPPFVPIAGGVPNTLQNRRAVEGMYFF